MILVGADPEVFAVKRGKLVSAHGMIPGTKKEPYKVECGAVQVDGMALEFNINPAACEDEFVYNIDMVMAQLKVMTRGHRLLAEPVAEFGKEMIDAQPEEAKELGCDPDFNAWEEGAENPVPNVDTPFRTGSGHVHLGLWDPNGPQPVNHTEVCLRVAKQLDCYLAAPFAFVDTDLRRRQLYGKAGAYRPKPYGLEYRTLSNKWLSCVDTKRWVFRNTQAAIQAVQHGVHPFMEFNEVEDAINQGDLRYLARMIREWDIPVPRAAAKLVRENY